MDCLAQLPPAVRGYLSDFLLRWRRLVALRALGTAMGVLALWTLAGCVADRLFHLSAPVRLAVLFSGGFTAIALGIIRLNPLRQAVDWVVMAATIERYDRRFNQALITVTSRMMGSPEHRGSDEILSHLLREVELRVADGRRRKILTLRFAARSWAVFILAAAALAGLCQVSGLGGPRLLARFVAPLADIPPVTTTGLRIIAPSHGDADVFQSEQLRFEVETSRVGSNPVWLFLNDDGANWSRYTMDDAGAGRFTYTVNAVGRDLLYYITAGDAVSPRHGVRVKRPPAIAQFRVRYTYPAYTAKAPFTVTNTDGTMEAPAGSEAVLTIISTEPLQSALLTVGDRKILMDRTGSKDDHKNERTATLRIAADSSYEVDLISTREVRGSGPAKMIIRATADHAPLVRLLQAGQTLRLNPRDILPLTFQAMDDYGLDAVSLVAQVNATPALRVPLRLSGDRHRQEDTLNFDLGSMKFEIGDLLTLTVVARDTAGQDTVSDELRVLISPRSVDLDALERITELNAAARFAVTLAGELDGAGKSLDDAEGQKDRQSPGYLAASARASRHLTSASESSTLLRQTLLRAGAHSDSPELSTALSLWVDGAQEQSRNAEDLFRRGGSTEGMGTGARERLRRAVEQARDLSLQLRTAAAGERASAMLADREDLKAARKRPAPTDPDAAGRLAKALARIDEEASAGAQEIGVNLSAGDAENQLRARIDAERALARSKQPVDFAAAARDWSQELQRDPRQITGLEARLATAAQAEAVRGDADLFRAHDLELASRAATAISAALAQTPAGKPVAAGQLNAFANSLAALQREHILARQPANSRTPDELRIARNVAERAREEMSRWAGEGAKTALAGGRTGEFESLALRASAAAARHDYKHAAQEDHALAQKLTDSVRRPGGHLGDPDPASATNPAADERIQKIEHMSEGVARQMATAETVDKLGQTQEKLVQESRSVRNAPADLAVRQRGVAEQIATVERQQIHSTSFAVAPAAHEMDDPNWRGRATAALLLAQEELAAMPQELAAAEESTIACRKAADRADAARREAAGAPPDRKPMLIRAADQAERDAKDAADRLDRTVAPLMPRVSTDLVERLEPFAPEASSARDVVSGPLATAFAALRTACSQNDPAAFSRAAGDIRKAIDSVQKELVRAQDSFTERDPLVAAKWFARAAADSLARHPTDLRTAMAHQANVSLALSHAWDSSVHRAAELRLAALPSLQAVYSAAPPVHAETASANNVSPTLASRDWARLHAREGDDLAATLRDPDPPGYEEPLRLYFEALGKAQDNPK